MNLQYLPQIDEARLHEVCTRLDVRLLILFGSHATGAPAPNEESDVDLALSIREPAQRRSWWAYHEALLEVFPERPLDLVWLADADPLLRWEIMRAGVLLYGKNFPLRLKAKARSRKTRRVSLIVLPNNSFTQFVL